MKIHKNDKVKVITGKDKGKISKVLLVNSKENLVLVEGVNFVTKHVKPNKNNKEGGIVKFEKPIHVSNVMYYCEENKGTSRLGYKIVEGKKYRYLKKFDKIVEKSKNTNLALSKDTIQKDKDALKSKSLK